MKGKKSLINLIISEIKKLDQISLSEIYTDILKSTSLNKKKELENVEREGLVMEYINNKLDISDNTITSYQSVLLNFLKFIYPKINRENVTSYLNKVDSRWKSKTKRRNHILIRSFLNYLFEMRYLDEDISKCIKIPKKVRVLQYVPRDEEIEVFFSTLKRKYTKKRDRMIYFTIFAFYAKTGLRLNELINLNYEDIDLKNKKIFLKETKNHDIDYVPIDQELETILLNYISTFNIKGGALIRGKGGRKIHKNVITNNLKRIVKEAGLPKDFTAHAFRRYFIDKQRRSGTDIFLLKELARHEDINTTYEYCNVREEERIKAMENIQIAV